MGVKGRARGKVRGIIGVRASYLALKLTLTLAQTLTCIGSERHVDSKHCRVGVEGGEQLVAAPCLGLRLGLGLGLGLGLELGLGLVLVLGLGLVSGSGLGLS